MRSVYNNINIGYYINFEEVYLFMKYIYTLRYKHLRYSLVFQLDVLN